MPNFNTYPDEITEYIKPENITLLTAYINQALATTTENITGMYLHNMQVINIMQAKYGIIADGSTDNTAGMLLALADSYASGWPLYAPAGQYKVDTALAIPGETVKIFGDGIGRTVFIGSSPTAVPNDFMTFTDAGFDGTQELIVRGCDFTNFNSVFTGDQHLNWLDIEQNSFYNNREYAAYWIRAADAPNSRINYINTSKNRIKDTWGFLMGCRIGAAVGESNAMENVQRVGYAASTTVNCVGIQFGDTNDVAIADGQDEMKNISVRYNVMKGVVGTSTDGQNATNGIVVVGDGWDISHNIIAGVNAVNLTDCECIYTKAKNGSMTRNLMVGCANVGSGMLTVKGGPSSQTLEPQSYNNDIDGNVLVATATLTSEIGIGINAPHEIRVTNNTISGPFTKTAITVYESANDIQIEDNKGKSLSCEQFIHFDGVPEASDVSVKRNRVQGMLGTDEAGGQGICSFMYLRALTVGPVDIAVEDNTFKPNCTNANAGTCTFFRYAGPPNTGIRDLRVNKGNTFDLLDVGSNNIYFVELSDVADGEYQGLVVENNDVLDRGSSGGVDSWVRIANDNNTWRHWRKIPESVIENCRINGVLAEMKAPLSRTPNIATVKIRMSDLVVGQNETLPLFRNSKLHHAIPYINGTATSATSSATLEIRIDDSPGTGGTQVVAPIAVGAMPSNGYLTSLLTWGGETRQFGSTANPVKIYLNVGAEVFTGNADVYVDLFYGELS